MTLGEVSDASGRGVSIAGARRGAGLFSVAGRAFALAGAMAGAVVPMLARAAGAVYSADHFIVAPGGYTPARPVEGKGMPVPGGTTFQTQYSPTGEEALWMHDHIVMTILIAVSVFVAALLLWVIVRYNSRANPVPSKTSHNTLLEVIWTGVPVFILLVVFVPSMQLLAHQYKTPPANAVTIKATGNQWYWTYSYPDNGGFEVISNMLPDAEAVKRGEPPQLGADNRMVVPAGEPIRIQTIGADVIHSFAVPSLWFKIDAVPGRINERLMFIKEPGVYYGQCSELCGARHGYMPIVVEALPRAKYNAWVMTHAGAKIDGAPEAAPAATAADAPPAAAAAAPAEPAAAETTSSAPGA